MAKFVNSKYCHSISWHHSFARAFGRYGFFRESASFYKWRAKYGGMDVSIMFRMKELEEENRRLKKMYLEEKLKAEIVLEALEKKWRGHPDAKRWP